MKINGILNNNYTPTFKKLEDVVAYPELLEYYDISEINAAKTDVLSTNAIVALGNKLAKAYRLLFTPDVTSEANRIQEGIDTLFDEPKTGQILDTAA